MKIWTIERDDKTYICLGPHLVVWFVYKEAQRKPPENAAFKWDWWICVYSYFSDEGYTIMLILFCAKA